MRFLIAIVVLACATGAYSAPEPKPDPAGPAVILPPKEPTFSPGDINGAAIEVAVEQSDALVEAVDLQRAAFDAANQVNDHVGELQRQQIDAADEQGWKTVGSIQTIEARSDGSFAAAAPVLAKQYVRQNGIQPVARVPGAGLYGDQRYAAPFVAQRYGAVPGAYAPGLFGAGIAPLAPVPTVLPTPVSTVAAAPGSLALSSDVSSSIAIPDEAPEDILKTSDAKTSSSSASSTGSASGYTSSLTSNQGPTPTAQSATAGALGYSAQVAPNPVYDPYGYNYNYNYNGLNYPGYVPQVAAPYYSASYPQYYQNPYYGSPYNAAQTPYNPYTRFY